MSVALVNGEVFRGNLAPIDPADNAAASSPDLQHAWDFVYGSGYYRASILSSNNSVRALLMGSNGSTAILELHNGRGVARDSHNNVYKVTVTQ